MLPVDHITTGSMAPRHGSPRGPARIILVIHMIDAIIVKQSIWIVHPILLWGEVILWSIWLGVGLAEDSMNCAESENQSIANEGTHLSDQSSTKTAPSEVFGTEFDNAIGLRMRFRSRYNQGDGDLLDWIVVFG